MSEATRRKLAEANRGPNEKRRGENAGNWKGGKTRTVHGYIEVQAPDHPLAVRGGYIREHRLVAETHLRESDPSSPFLLDGYLHPGADVHHINEVKDDNRIENLEVMWRGQHTRRHLPGLQNARWPKET